VGGWEVGAKCSVMQGCCVGGRLGVRSCWSMVQVVASTLCRALGWGKALALVGVLGMWRNFGGKESFSALLLFFWRRGVGGGCAEQRERRDMSMGVGERCPPTQSQEKSHIQRTTGKQPGC